MHNYSPFFISEGCGGKEIYLEVFFLITDIIIWRALVGQNLFLIT